MFGFQSRSLLRFLQTSRMASTSGKHPNKMKKKGQINPSPNTIVYKGPIKLPKSINEAEVYTLQSSFAAELTSSVAGAITSVLGSWPSSLSDWANIVATFHEVRTLGMRFIYQPSNKYNRGTVTTRPIASVVDHSDSGSIASYTSAANHESGKLHSLDDSFSVTVKMTGTEEAQFQDVATAAATGNRFYIKLYADGLSLSTSYGVYFVQYLYQVRGRK